MRWRSRCRGASGSSCAWSSPEGLRILRRIDDVGGDVFRHRPTLTHARLVGDVARGAARMTDPFAYCDERLAQSGRASAYSFRILPEPRRRAITALYAFCREVDDVVDEVSDPAVARVKLAWWRGEVAADLRRQALASGSAGAQPVVGSFDAARENFDAIIDGMSMDLDQNRYLDLGDARALLPPRRRRRRPAVGAHLRIRGRAHARLRGRPGHRLPADQHHPRRRRGRAARAHLSAAGRACSASACRRATSWRAATRTPSAR